jgi:phosphopantothenoylcysteine decarboxylase / phosphopantothenate---cysteine ligase
MKLLLAVCGSIAAYKAPILAREFIKRGVEIRVVMTPSATAFASPLALQNLTHHPVAVEMFDERSQSGGSWHIHLARWCDAMLIAPCSAATLGKIAHGISDTALTLVALALPPEKPLFVAPAMDTEMWLHPATQRNLGIVAAFGANIIPPATGELASGLHGVGRLPEPEDIVRIVSEKLSARKDLSGLHVLITAGPTYEAIDDVRFVGNRSSGKMGFALAGEAATRGAKVTLVSGPVALQTPPNVERIDVESAEQMYNAVMEREASADIVVCAAAVADFTPRVRHEGKLKKSSFEGAMTIELAQTRDILGTLGKQRQHRHARTPHHKPHQIIIGFALEAANYEEYGRKKLVEKNCDMIVLNAANKVDSGFGGDNNTITLLSHDREQRSFPPMTKNECARVIMDAVEENVAARV